MPPSVPDTRPPEMRSDPGAAPSPVTRTVPGTDELLLEIATRYLPPDKVPAYIEFAEAELGEQVAIYLRPERWLTADLGPGDIPPA